MFKFKDFLRIARVAPVALLSFLAISQVGIGAPCCGGASSIPTLMTGDDRAQFSAIVSQGSVVGDAPAHGVPVFRKDSDSEITQTVLLSGSYLISDLWQWGAGLPIVRRSRDTGGGQAAATGLGDVTTNVAFEFLPERSYSLWRPKGYVFFQMTLPTSPSVYDAHESYQVDARGRGFFALALGTAFIKTIDGFDLLASLEGHRSFSRTLENSDGSELRLSPGFGGSMILGGGYSPGGGAFRIGASVSPVYEDAIHSNEEVAGSEPESKLVWNTSLQLGYAIQDEWSTSLTYTDQTLIGPAKNVTLSRTVTFIAQKRWAL
jgi:hypothetical protein